MPEFASPQKKPQTKFSSSGLPRGKTTSSDALPPVSRTATFGRDFTNIPATTNGPQSFAALPLGKQLVDPALVKLNRDTEKRLFEVGDAYYAQKDLRWMFAYAHAMITKQINSSLASFQRPNEILHLNMHFGNEWIRAASGTPHESWQEAFLFCHVIQDVSLPLEVEMCAAKMANVHIRVDLAAALSEVGCIPPTDYGNMLVLVNRGNLAALAHLRGRVIGGGEFILQSVVAPKLGLDVEIWRNAVYRLACNADVPPVEAEFYPDKPQ